VIIGGEQWLSGDGVVLTVAEIHNWNVGCEFVCVVFFCIKILQMSSVAVASIRSYRNIMPA
jgi:hypothetical protein